MQSWTVGILCYNEAGTIEKVFLDTISVLKRMTTDFEIIIVDDASNDGSIDIVKNLSNDYSKFLRVLYHKSNMGIGLSIRDIYFNAVKENVVFVPGDGQFEVKELYPYASFPMNNFIAFYRKENQSYSFFRNSLSYMNKQFNRLFLGLELRDVNWVKVYKTSILKQLDLQSKSSIIESEICSKLAIKKIKAIEVESKYIPRVYGESKGSSWKIIKKVYAELWSVYLLVRKYKKLNKA
jgi:glycosyltransferase involved in cell wall biosynthesis